MRCSTLAAALALSCDGRERKVIADDSSDSIQLPGMLDQARSRRDVDWVLGDLSSVHWDREFDLVVMTGHAFQELVEDDEVHTALRAIRAALVDGGRFSFETRNILDRAWERWPDQYSDEVMAPGGAVVRKVYQVETPVEGSVVRSISTYTCPAWDHPTVSRGALRFMSADTVTMFLSQAGLVIDDQFGDWDRQPLSNTSPEIITFARKGDARTYRS